MKRSRLWMALLLAPPASLALQAWQATRAPTPADLQCAATTISEGWREGDVVRFAPLWAHEGWPLLKDRAVQDLPADDPDEAWRHRRLWVLESDAWSDLHSWPEGWSEDRRVECGGARVILVRLPDRGAPLYDFEDHLKDARMFLVLDGPGERPRLPPGPWKLQDVPHYPCNIFLAGRHRCVPHHAWQWVGPVSRDVDDVVRSGLWAHPPPGGHKLQLDYPDVPLGRTLAVEAGLTLASTRSALGTPVHFEVILDDEKVLERVVRPDEKGWFRWRIDTSEWAGKRRRVRFRVYAEDDNRMRQWMFSARAWE